MKRKKILTHISKLIILIILVLNFSVSCSVVKTTPNENNQPPESETQVPFESETQVPIEWQDSGIFSEYYEKAYQALQELTLDEKIEQLFLVRYSEKAASNNYNFGGYILFAKDFRDKTEGEIKSEISKLQANAKIPFLIAVDEEGGTVVRVSSNKNLIDEKFKSPSELYKLGGFKAIKEDTITKSKFLEKFGINLNLAPVVDVSTNPNDYMYSRSLRQNAALTSTYAETVIKASKDSSVSYTLKHFPGYGNNLDTHVGSSIDKRTYDDILNNDLPPFQAGINAGAEAVMVSHNIVTSIDANNAASLSLNIHQLLREELEFTGVIITDDLDMGAVSSDKNRVEKAVLAGNDLIIVTDYKSSIAAVKNSLDEGKITQDYIDKAAFKILAWKYYKGLI